MRNFNNQKVEIAMRYREELTDPGLVINDHSRVCFNCDLLPTRDEEALQNPGSSNERF